MKRAKGLSLRALCAELGGELHSPESVADVHCLDVRIDSRESSSGTLFAALPGAQVDGRDFALDAARRGASALLTPTLVEAARRAAPELVQWIHPDARRVAGLAASLIFGEPSRDLFAVGVTGTNGKTTVCHLVAQILQHCGRRAGVLGTAGHQLAAAPSGQLAAAPSGNGQGEFGNFAGFKLENVPATHTTSDGPTLQRLLGRHRHGGGDAIALELSSHALDQERHAGLQLDVAVYTNLTREHLDYHGDLDEYARAKAELFHALRPGAVAVINEQASHAEVMVTAARQAGAQVVTYGIETADPSPEERRSLQRIRSFNGLCASRLEAGTRGTTFFLSGMGISGEQVVLPLAGRFNVENALAALAASLLSGASPSTAVEGLAAVFPAPGRLERVDLTRAGNKNENSSRAEQHVPEVFVDYAHTSDALENVLSTLRATLEARGESAGELITVFGCGGDRDATKRAPMGEVVDRLSDVAVLTSDNPRSETPEDICADVLRGMSASRAALHVEPDRARAIRFALERAGKGDIVLVAGKGHEATQEIHGRKFPFDDRLEIAAILKERS